MCLSLFILSHWNQIELILVLIRHFFSASGPGHFFFRFVFKFFYIDIKKMTGNDIRENVEGSVTKVWNQFVGDQHCVNPLPPPPLPPPTLSRPPPFSFCINNHAIFYSRSIFPFINIFSLCAAGRFHGAGEQDQERRRFFFCCCSCEIRPHY